MLFSLSNPGWGNILKRKISGFESSYGTNSSNSQAREAYNKSVFCFHYLGICLKYTTRDHFPVARSGHVGNRTEFSTTPHSKKHTGYWERSPFQSDFLLHKSLLICFPPLVSFQGLLGRKRELLRSD